MTQQGNDKEVDGEDVECPICLCGRCRYVHSLCGRCFCKECVEQLRRCPFCLANVSSDQWLPMEIEDDDFDPVIQASMLTAGKTQASIITAIANHQKLPFEERPCCSGDCTVSFAVGVSWDGVAIVKSTDDEKRMPDNLDPDVTVIQFKECLACRLGVSVDQFFLIHTGKKINTKTLRAAGVTDGSNLYVHLTMPDYK